jgi:hypothetical protein
MTALDWWKFHRGIVDTPKPKPKSYSLYHRNGVTIVHDKPYQYVMTVKKQYPNAEIKPNY